MNFKFKVGKNSLKKLRNIFYHIIVFIRFRQLYSLICDALHDLVPSVQFLKSEKHPWRNVTFRKVAGLACNFTKSNTPPWVFPRFLNCTNVTKPRKTSHVVKTYQEKSKYDLNGVNKKSYPLQTKTKKKT